MVSAINSAGSAPAAPAPAVSHNARAVDGDYKTKGVGRSSVKDSDGDYKPTTQAKSTTAVQAALTLLKQGG